MFFVVVCFEMKLSVVVDNVDADVQSTSLRRSTCEKSVSSVRCAMRREHRASLISPDRRCFCNIMGCVCRLFCVVFVFVLDSNKGALYLTVYFFPRELF